MLSIIFSWVVPVFAEDSDVTIFNLGPEGDEDAVTEPSIRMGGLRLKAAGR